MTRIKTRTLGILLIAALCTPLFALDTDLPFLDAKVKTVVAFKDGTSSPGGPAIARASEELIRLRVTGLKYPKGYKPKRDTNQMTRLPLAEPEVPYLYAYLKEVRKPE